MISALIFAAVFTDAGKNVAEAAWMKLPEEPAAIVRAVPHDAWNFGFRKYGATSDMLWTDPKAQRDALAGAAGDQRVNAVAFACDENAFTILVSCTEPKLGDYLAKGQKYPSPMIEFLLAPGDADTSGIGLYYTFVYEGAGRYSEYSFVVPEKRFRRLKPLLTITEGETGGNAILVKAVIPWYALYNRLPLWPEKRENFWRVGVIPYASGATWGGVVHQANQAGLVRLPEFTAERRAAIMKKILLRAWEDYKTLTVRYDLGYGKLPADKEAYGLVGYAVPDPAKYQSERVAKHPRTYVNYAEDPAFRPVQEKLLKERDAIGPALASFDALDADAQKAFYLENAPKLIEYKADLEAAYGAYVHNRLMKE